MANVSCRVVPLHNWICTRHFLQWILGGTVRWNPWSETVVTHILVKTTLHIYWEEQYFIDIWSTGLINFYSYNLVDQLLTRFQLLYSSNLQSSCRTTVTFHANIQCVPTQEWLAMVCIFNMYLNTAYWNPLFCCRADSITGPFFWFVIVGIVATWRPNIVNVVFSIK